MTDTHTDTHTQTHNTYRHTTHTDTDRQIHAFDMHALLSKSFISKVCPFCTIFYHVFLFPPLTYLSSPPPPPPPPPLPNIFSFLFNYLLSQMIADWRDTVGYDDFLKKRREDADLFHRLWPEQVYGKDKFGHIILGMRVGDIDTDGLCDMEEEKMLQLQGQKMTAITQHKIDMSEASGVQRYKHTAIVDLKGTGMSLLGGKKRGIIQRVFGVGADYYPESVWRIYVVNTPFVFRACWAIVRPWIHPITQAKVNIFGSVKECVKKMAELDGITAAELPSWCDGTNPGKKVSEILAGYIAQGGATRALADSVAAMKVEPEEPEDE